MNPDCYFNIYRNIYINIYLPMKCFGILPSSLLLSVYVSHMPIRSIILLSIFSLQAFVLHVNMHACNENVFEGFFSVFMQKLILNY